MLSAPAWVESVEHDSNPIFGFVPKSSPEQTQITLGKSQNAPKFCSKRKTLLQ